MAPRKKYQTDEERREARRRSRREYYARNLERERARALSNWNARREASKARERVRNEEPHLPQTVQLLGPSLHPSASTSLPALENALDADLNAWKHGKRVKDAWRYYTKRLLSQEKAGTLNKQVENLFRRGIQLAERIKDVALRGEGEAWKRIPPGDYGADIQDYQDLGKLAIHAKLIANGLQELLDIFNEGGNALSRAYEDGTLYWQRKA
ncbi:hypothetical protein EXIGLDRAFT_698122 [Exidia glandulosa HHB12029]|uniref:Uncharacterized protein n=1 Tax=Exidia glandulosa HHB12029 TaxID=1314781 RepID=A0A165EEZ3_EXIGL|nr:hypothetical protein EXIGLDRAFT_698122 [Exidia glandulosa HHB12029]